MVLVRQTHTASISFILMRSSDPRDNLWPVRHPLTRECKGRRTDPILLQIVTNLILTPTMAEFGGSGAWIKLGQAIGLLIGAAFWGLASDVWGRRYVAHVSPPLKVR